MIAVDTNILVYAQREDSPHHTRAVEALRAMVRRTPRWAVPWPCVHEFLAVVTHPRVYRPSTEADHAIGAVRDLLGSGAQMIGEGDRHLDVLERLLASSGVTGARVHDARIAAICLAHGVTELWTADRDYSYFPELVTRNPLV